jgi:hypothetical protein
MRILIWDVHGGYTDALTRAPHEFLFLHDDTVDDPDGLSAKGLVRLGDDRPGNLREVSVEEIRDVPPDVVLAQRRFEVDAAARMLRRVPGRQVGAVYLEHNTPKGDVPATRHPLADRQDWLIVHVTHFNRLFWDCGAAPTIVIEHGLPDPGYRYTGTRKGLAFVINEPVRRWRTTGTDLLPWFGDLPIDAFGIDGQLLPQSLEPHCPRLEFAGNLGPTELLAAVAQRRAYLHLTRWTSLGLSLIEAMLLGLPVVVLETTEAARAVPLSAGARSTDVTDLVRSARHLLSDLEDATERGLRGRAYALERYGLQRYLDDWTACWERVAV